MSAAAEALAFGGLLRAAAAVGLVDALDARPQRASELAERLGLAQGPVALVLDALVAFDVARRDDLGYSRGPVASPHHLGIASELHLWDHAQAWLRHGESLAGFSGAESPWAYHRAAEGLSRLWGDAPALLARRLPLAPRRVLDLGCGAGPWSLAILECFPEAVATGVDHEAVVGRFVDAVGARGLTSRARGVASDLDALPGSIGDDFDLVILANVLRLDGPEVARARLLHAAARRCPGGAVLVVDALAGGSPEAEIARTVYAVHLALRRPRGALVSAEQIRGWLVEAGLGRVEALPLEGAAGALGALWAA